MKNGYPNLLYCCDLPPSGSDGGMVLIDRILKEVPEDALTVLCSSSYVSRTRVSGGPTRPFIAFPTTNSTGRLGLGRIKNLINWLLLPAVGIYAAHLIRRKNARAVLTVSQEQFFLAAALAARLTGRPLVLFVHDDWAGHAERIRKPLWRLHRPLFRLVARSAARVYAVSPFMQELLREECGVASELQMPANEFAAETAAPPPDATPDRDRPVRIVYAGSGTNAMHDAREVLIRLVQSDPAVYGFQRPLELHLFGKETQEHAERFGWVHPRVVLRGWATQEQLRTELRQADLLFLPFSFGAEERYATTRAFPSKTADYLAAERPILIFGPPDSTIVRYAREWGFAEVVDEDSPEALARGIARVVNDPHHAGELVRNACRVRAANHDIRTQRAEFRQALTDLVSPRR